MGWLTSLVQGLAGALFNSVLAALRQWRLDREHDAGVRAQQANANLKEATDAKARADAVLEPARADLDERLHDGTL